MDRRDYEEIERREARNAGGGTSGGAAVLITFIKWGAIVFIVLIFAYLILSLAGVIEGVAWGL